MAKPASLHGQRKVLASLLPCSCVNSCQYWRQLRIALTPTRRTGHRRNLLGHRKNQGWPQDRPLLDRRREGLAYASERVCPLERQVRGAFPPHLPQTKEGRWGVLSSRGPRPRGARTRPCARGGGPSPPSRCRCGRARNSRRRRRSPRRASSCSADGSSAGTPRA